MDFRINDSLMGEEVKATKGSKAIFKLSLYSTNKKFNNTTIKLIKNGDVLKHGITHHKHHFLKPLRNNRFFWILQNRN